MKKCVRIIAATAMAVIIPNIVFAQSAGFADDIKSLHQVLERLYTEMLPLCSKLIGVGRGIAGFAATWYIASRVRRHIANAEPIDFYPLFRPFVLGFAVIIFPSVIAMINGVMKCHDVKRAESIFKQIKSPSLETIGAMMKGKILLVYAC